MSYEVVFWRPRRVEMKGVEEPTSPYKRLNSCLLPPFIIACDSLRHSLPDNKEKTDSLKTSQPPFTMRPLSAVVLLSTFMVPCDALRRHTLWLHRAEGLCGVYGRRGLSCPVFPRVMMGVGTPRKGGGEGGEEIRRRCGGS